MHFMQSQNPTLQHHVYSPWNQTLVTQTMMHSLDDVSRMLDKATQARIPMELTSSAERKGWLRNIAQKIHAQRDKFIQAIIQEAGKPYLYAHAEVDRAIATFELAADHSHQLGHYVYDLGVQTHTRNKMALTLMQPGGVVAAIAPFNFPLNLMAHKVAPAIACGCPVIVKPASQTPSSALLLQNIIDNLSLPLGAFQVLTTNRQIADHLVTDSRVNIVSFTGSPDVGWAIKAKAGHKKVILELGGNAAAVVMDDADIQLAASSCATSAFAYAGQVCISLQRLFVHKNIQQNMMDALLKATDDLQAGDPHQKNVHIGPMIDTQQADRIEQWVYQAIKNGAQLLRPWRREKNLVYPVMLTQVPQSEAIVSQEAFGPVVVIETVDSLEEAIHRVNDSRFGLQASIFTHRQHDLMTFFRGVHVGGVIHNAAPSLRSDHMPYGGIKDSGFGREGIPSAFADYLEPKSLIWDI